MKTEETIKAAIQALKAQGITPTQKLVCKESGLSIATIKRHWKGVCENKQGITPKVNRVSEADRESVKTDRVSPKEGQQGITNDVQGITEKVNRESVKTDKVSPIESKIPNPAFERFKRYRPSGNLQLNPNHL